MYVCKYTIYRRNNNDTSTIENSSLCYFAGRSVMLEQPRKAGTKVLSHMLASHGGEIYLHTLMATRSSLEDPPSISEGCGGRVTDYRISVCRSGRWYASCFQRPEIFHAVFLTNSLYLADSMSIHQQTTHVM